METLKYTPENITHLDPHQVFVFGSNNHARHGKGAAKTALQKFGAKNGVHHLCGQSYGLITVLCNATGRFNGKRASLSYIRLEISDFLACAKANPDREFLVTLVGCGLAGWNVSDIAPLWISREIPRNVILPKSFHPH